MAFDNNVFINCPFDQEYAPLLRALVFTTLYLDLEPYLSQTLSSSNIRVSQIKQHIRSCKFGIHDLSRSRAMKAGEFPRFNMPYELGLDIGACEFGGKLLKSKKILILETERHHYQKVLSDIAGQDISAHRNDPKTLVTKVRNWLSNNTADIVVVSQNQIWIAFNQFTDDLSILAPDYTPEDKAEMTIGDYIKFAKVWIIKFKAR